MNYLIGAYWGSRQESIGHCSERLRRFLKALGTYDDRLATWYERGRARPSPEDYVDPDDLARLTSLLDKGRNRRDVGGQAIDELGFHIGLWNGFKDYGDQAELSVTCGLYWTSDRKSASLGNAVVLDLPESLGDLADSRRMAELLSALAQAWEPAWAGVMSTQAMSDRGFDGNEPFVDWMVFVPWEVDAAALPVGQVLSGRGGTVLIAQLDPPDRKDAKESVGRRQVETLIRSL
jgi:hypothetical protein